jgi:hypothetical protein
VSDRNDIEQARKRLEQMAVSCERSAERGDVFDPNPQLAAMVVASSNTAKAIRALLADHSRLLERVGAVEAALGLAIAILGRQEPGDSRAVSDEYVGMAAVASGASTEADVAWLNAARERIDALPPLPYPEITVSAPNTQASASGKAEGDPETVQTIHGER